MQSAGHAYRLKGPLLKEAFFRAGPMLRVLLRYAQALLTQMPQTGAVAYSFGRQLDATGSRRHVRRLRGGTAVGTRLVAGNVRRQTDGDQGSLHPRTIGADMPGVHCPQPGAARRLASVRSWPKDVGSVTGPTRSPDVLSPAGTQITTTTRYES